MKLYKDMGESQSEQIVNIEARANIESIQIKETGIASDQTVSSGGKPGNEQAGAGEKKR